MSTITSSLFYQVCSKVHSHSHLQQLVMKLESYFDIGTYKIDKLHAEIAKKLYNLSLFKYQISKEITPNPDLWFQNQRKLFIWFIVCYFYQFQTVETEENKIVIFQQSIDWHEVSRAFFSKSVSLLKFQFNNILRQKNRISWTLEEDQLLCQAVHQVGQGCWNQISKYVFFNSDLTVFKTPKHCRERWLNHLDDSKKKGKWSDQQDYKLLISVKEYGKKWSRIASEMNNVRTEHMVKNRFNSLMTKVRKHKKQKEIHTINKIIRHIENSLKGSVLCQEKAINRTQLVSSSENLFISGQQIQNLKCQQNEDIEVDARLISLHQKNQLEEKTQIQNLFIPENNLINSDTQPVQNIFYNFMVPTHSFLQPTAFFCYSILPIATYSIQGTNYLLGFSQDHLQSSPTLTNQQSSSKTQPVYIVQQNNFSN